MIIYREVQSNEASGDENEVTSNQDKRAKKRTYGVKDPSPGRFRGRGSEDRSNRRANRDFTSQQDSDDDRAYSSKQRGDDYNVKAAVDHHNEAK